MNFILFTVSTDFLSNEFNNRKSLLEVPVVTVSNVFYEFSLYYRNIEAFDILVYWFTL